MSLTTAQAATLKADMLGASATALATLLSNSDFQGIKDYYNFQAPGALKVWRPDAGVNEIRGQITWANLTPTDVVPTPVIPSAPTLAEQVAGDVWRSRSLACQGKQFNLQMLLTAPTGLVPGDIATFRAGFQDALTGIPSGAAGALLSGGWVGVRDNALQRLGTRFEVLFATVDGVASKSTAYGIVLDTNDCNLAFYS